MSDFSCFVPHVYNEDLLECALDSIASYGENRFIIDNSPRCSSLGYHCEHLHLSEIVTDPKYLGRWNGVKVIQPTVPLSCSQTFNLIMRLTLEQGKKFCVWMHSDAHAPDGTADALLEFMRKTEQDHPKWGVIFTHYDVLSVLNAELLYEVGLWDTILPQYFCDNDYYRRLKLAGYEAIESRLHVDHVGSQTINSNAERKFLNSVTFPIYQHYYIQKWGGEPGKELFVRPFNR